MTINNDIEERIRLVELELAEIKTRLDKKHGEIDGLQNEMSKLTDCINKVTILTEKVNTTQKDMWSELKDVRDKQEEDIKELRDKLDNANKSIIQHSVTFESYRDRQKSAYTLLGFGLTAVSFIVPVIMQLILR